MYLEVIYMSFKGIEHFSRQDLDNEEKNSDDLLIRKLNFERFNAPKWKTKYYDGENHEETLNTEIYEVTEAFANEELLSQKQIKKMQFFDNVDVIDFCPDKFIKIRAQDGISK